MCGLMSFLCRLVCCFLLVSSLGCCLVHHLLGCLRVSGLELLEGLRDLLLVGFLQRLLEVLRKLFRSGLMRDVVARPFEFLRFGCTRGLGHHLRWGRLGERTSGGGDRWHGGEEAFQRGDALLMVCISVDD